MIDTKSIRYIFLLLFFGIGKMTLCAASEQAKIQSYNDYTNQLQGFHLLLNKSQTSASFEVEDYLNGSPHTRIIKDSLDGTTVHLMFEKMSTQKWGHLLGLGYGKYSGELFEYSQVLFELNGVYRFSEKFFTTFGVSVGHVYLGKIQGRNDSAIIERMKWGAGFQVGIRYLLSKAFMAQLKYRSLLYRTQYTFNGLEQKLEAKFRSAAFEFGFSYLF